MTPFINFVTHLKTTTNKQTKTTNEIKQTNKQLKTTKINPYRLNVDEKNTRIAFNEPTTVAHNDAVLVAQLVQRQFGQFADNTQRKTKTKNIFRSRTHTHARTRALIAPWLQTLKLKASCICVVHADERVAIVPIDECARHFCAHNGVDSARLATNLNCRRQGP